MKASGHLQKIIIYKYMINIYIFNWRIILLDCYETYMNKGQSESCPALIHNIWISYWCFESSTLTASIDKCTDHTYFWRLNWYTCSAYRMGTTQTQPNLICKWLTLPRMVSNDYPSSYLSQELYIVPHIPSVLKFHIYVLLPVKFSLVATSVQHMINYLR